MMEAVWDKLRGRLAEAAKESLTWKMAGGLSMVWRRSLLYSWLTADWAAKSAFCRAIGALLQKIESFTARGESKETAAKAPEASLPVTRTIGLTLLLAVALFLPFLRFRTLFALIAFTAVFLFFRRVPLRWPRSGAFVPAILFLLVQFYAAVTSVSLATSLFDFLIAAAGFLYLLLLTGTIEKSGELDSLVRMLAVCSFLVAGYAVYNYYFGTPIGELGKIWVDPNTNPDIKNRAYAVFDNPNLLAHYLVLTFPLLLAGLGNARRFSEQIFFLAAAALNVYCLLLTYSRGGWLGFAAAAGVFAVVRSRFLLLALPPAGAVLYFFLPATVHQRLANLTSLKDASNLYRLDIWNSTLDLLKDYWLYGVGLGWRAFTRIYYTYMRNSAIIPHAHNLFLQLLSEMGIVGLGIFLWLLLALFRLGLKLSAAGSRAVKNLSAGVCGALAGFFIHSFFDYTLWYYSLAIFFWILIAILLLLEKLARGEDGQGEGEV